jgi:hypothetical protein
MSRNGASAEAKGAELTLHEGSPVIRAGIGSIAQMVSVKASRIEIATNLDAMDGLSCHV